MMLRIIISLTISLILFSQPACPTHDVDDYSKHYISFNVKSRKSIVEKSQEPNISEITHPVSNQEDINSQNDILSGSASELNGKNYSAISSDENTSASQMFFKAKELESPPHNTGIDKKHKNTTKKTKIHKSKHGKHKKKNDPKQKHILRNIKVDPFFPMGNEGKTAWPEDDSKDIPYIGMNTDQNIPIPEHYDRPATTFSTVKTHSKKVKPKKKNIVNPVVTKRHRHVKKHETTTMKAVVTKSILKINDHKKISLSDEINDFASHKETDPETNDGKKEEKSVLNKDTNKDNPFVTKRHRHAKKHEPTTMKAVVAENILEANDHKEMSLSDEINLKHSNDVASYKEPDPKTNDGKAEEKLVLNKGKNKDNPFVTKRHRHAKKHETTTMKAVVAESILEKYDHKEMSLSDEKNVKPSNDFASYKKPDAKTNDGKKEDKSASKRDKNKDNPFVTKRHRHAKKYDTTTMKAVVAESILEANDHKEMSLSDEINDKPSNDFASHKELHPETNDGKKEKKSFLNIDKNKDNPFVTKRHRHAKKHETTTMKAVVTKDILRINDYEDMPVSDEINVKPANDFASHNTPDPETNDEKKEGTSDLNKDKNKDNPFVTKRHRHAKKHETTTMKAVVTKDILRINDYEDMPVSDEINVKPANDFASHNAPDTETNDGKKEGTSDLNKGKNKDNPFVTKRHRHAKKHETTTMKAVVTKDILRINDYEDMPVSDEINVKPANDFASHNAPDTETNDGKKEGTSDLNKGKNKDNPFVTKQHRHIKKHETTTMKAVVTKDILRINDYEDMVVSDEINAKPANDFASHKEADHDTNDGKKEEKSVLIKDELKALRSKYPNANIIKENYPHVYVISEKPVTISRFDTIITTMTSNVKDMTEEPYRLGLQIPISDAIQANNENFHQKQVESYGINTDLSDINANAEGNLVGGIKSKSKDLTTNNEQKDFLRKATKLCAKACLEGYKHVCKRLRCASKARHSFKRYCRSSCRKSFIDKEDSDADGSS